MRHGEKVYSLYKCTQNSIKQYNDDKEEEKETNNRTKNAFEQEKNNR